MQPESPEEIAEPSHRVGDDWYVKAFNALYPIVYAHRTVEAAKPESKFAAEQLHLSPSDRVLDLCCGNGRHMVHLLNRTPHVIGLDYSADLLHIAARQVGDSAELVRGDMRALPFVRQFDAVANFFTSFGYFTAPEENLAVVQGLARVLKPGGRFFIDYLNPPYVRETLVPESTRREAEYTITETRWIDEESRRVNKILVVHHEKTQVMRAGESVFLYTLEELEELLSGAGLEIERVFGDYDGQALDEARPRMILVGRGSDSHGQLG